MKNKMKGCFADMSAGKKRIVAALLCVCVLLGVVPNIAYAGNYQYDLVADADTSTPDSGFGTAAYDGAVWADKTVIANEDNFTVKLSTLSQEYVITDTGSSEISDMKAADVLLILDVTGSMKRGIKSTDTSNVSDYRTSRAYYMVEAANKAIDIILKANERNRILVVMFAGKNNKPWTYELLPLNHYTSTNTAVVDGETVTQYFTINSSYSFSTVPSLQCVGEGGYEAYSNSTSSSTGTYTQYGIGDGIQKLIAEVGNGTADVKTLPFVLLLTDGEATSASSNWYGTPAQLQSNAVTNSSRLSALTILTAAYQKDLLSAKYKAFNGGEEVDVNWYNIGLSVSATAENSAKFILEPSYVANTANTSTTVNNVRQYIGSYATGEYASYAVNSLGEPGYIYEDDHIYYVENKAALNEAFDDLSQAVQEATKLVVKPITTSTTASFNATDSIVFTDKLGDGMVLDGMPSMAGVAGTVKSSSDNVTIYEFSGYGSLAKYDANTNTMYWSIASVDLPSVTYVDPSDPTMGYTAVPTPLSLTYDVSVQTEQEGVFYSNSVASPATAEFTPRHDNPYYHSISEESGSVVYTQKASLDSVEKTNKSLTATNDYVRDTNWGTGSIANQIIITLGNNGVMTLQSTNVTVSSDSDGDGEKDDSITYKHGDTIRIDPNGGKWGGTTDVTEKTLDDDFVIDDATDKEGYDFAGWEITEDPDEGIAALYEAQWDAIEYTISYNLDGGELTAGTTNPAVYTVESDNITLNNPQKSGYTFIGWTGTDLGSVTQTVVIPTGSVGNRSYTALWEQNEVEISYDGDGDGQADEAETANETEKILVKPEGGIWRGSSNDQTITLNDDTTVEAPVRDGYDFKGWSVSEGTGDEVLIFTALWEQTPVDVTYDGDGDPATPVDEETFNQYDKIQINPNGGQWGGTTAVTTKTLTSDFAITDATDNPGFEFDGWEITDGTGDIVKVFTAKWKAVPVEVTYDDNGDGSEDKQQGLNQYDKITVDPNGGIWNDSAEAQTFEVEEDTALGNPTRDGFTFIGWEKTPGDGDVKWVFEAQWEANPVDVNVNHDGDSETPDQEHPYYENDIIKIDPNGGKWGGTTDISTITLEDDLVIDDATDNEGHRFAGWEKLPGEGEEKAIYKAIWEILPFDVEYDDDGDDDTSDKTDPLKYFDKIQVDPNGGEWNGETEVSLVTLDKSVGNPFVIADAVNNPGCTFKGWDVSAGTEPGIVKKYTAIWERNDIAVIFDSDGDGTNDGKTELHELDKVLIKPNGGKYDGSTADVEKTLDRDFTLLTPEREGYVFKGWAPSNADGYAKVYTAQWEKKPLVISDNDGDGIPDDTVEVIKGKKITVDPNGGIWNGSGEVQTVTVEGDYTVSTPTREDYIFDGWDVTPGTGDVEYIYTARWREKAILTSDSDGDGNPDNNAEVDNDTKIIIDPNGGRFNGSGSNYSFSVNGNYNIPDASRKGYTFKGWTSKRSDDGSYVYTANWEKNEEPVEILSEVPQTGSSGYTVLLFAVALMSAATLCWSVISEKKRKAVK